VVCGVEQTAVFGACGAAAEWSRYGFIGKREKTVSVEVVLSYPLPDGRELCHEIRKAQVFF
jgi:hypothetical protein